MEHEYTSRDALDDLQAARALGLGVNAPDFEHGYAAAVEWLDANGLRGVRHRYLAERGHVLWCPDWCQCGHGPLQILDPIESGGSHRYLTHQIGHVRATFAVWESFDGTEREHVVEVRPVEGAGAYGFDGYLDLPLAAVPDLIALLQNLPLPEGITSGGQS